MNNPVISVVIPTLNEEKYIKACLESFKKQTFADFELIITDGASADSTLEIAKKYTDKILINSKGNVCQQRDRGLRAALGSILVGADADTVYPTNYLEGINDIFQKEQNVVLVTCRHQTLDGPYWGLFIMRSLTFFVELFYKSLNVLIYAPAFCISYRKDVFLKIGGYNTNLDFGGDELDVMHRLKKEGKVVYSSGFTVTTSGRRFKVGFLHFLKHIVINYWLNYMTAKMLGRQYISAKPVR